MPPEPPFRFRPKRHKLGNATFFVTGDGVRFNRVSPRMAKKKTAGDFAKGLYGRVEFRNFQNTKKRKLSRIVIAGKSDVRHEILHSMSNHLLADMGIRLNMQSFLAHFVEKVLFVPFDSKKEGEYARRFDEAKTLPFRKTRYANRSIFFYDIAEQVKKYFPDQREARKIILEMGEDMVLVDAMRKLNEEPYTSVTYFRLSNEGVTAFQRILNYFNTRYIEQQLNDSFRP